MLRVVGCLVVVLGLGWLVQGCADEESGAAASSCEPGGANSSVPGVSASGLSFRVTTRDDVEDAGDGQVSLREALLLAAPVGGVVTFAPGVSGTLALRAPLVVEGSADAARVTIRGPGRDLLELDGGGATRLLEVRGQGVELEGLTLQGGSAPEGGAVRVEGATLLMRGVRIRSSAATEGAGGGVLVVDGRLDLEGVSISDNTAATGGGGISLERSSLTANDLSLYNNSAARGGAMWSRGEDLQGRGTAVLVGGEVSANEAREEDGGAWLQESGVLSSYGTTWSGNKAARSGGAISIGRNVWLWMEGGRFEDNAGGERGRGGAVSAPDGLVQMSDVLLEDNAVGASGEGGALWIGSTAFGGPPLSLVRCLLSGNRAGSGGAIWSLTNSGMRLDGTRLLSNEATTGDGGAIYAALTGMDPQGLLRFVDVELDTNRAAGSGGGIWAQGGEVLLLDVLLEDNAAPSGAALMLTDAPVKIGARSRIMDNASEAGGVICSDGSVSVDPTLRLGGNSADYCDPAAVIALPEPLEVRGI